MERVCIAGCGYIGERVARLLKADGAEVLCTTRSAERREVLVQLGVETIACTLDDPDNLPALDTPERILFYFVPPPGGGFRDPRARNFCAILERQAPPEKIIYISATSVYGAIDGEIVTEETPVGPGTAMGKRRLDAEQVFTNYGEAHGIPVIILRVSGIYGPGRLPLMQVSQGQPLLRQEEAGPSNRIHADDLARVCVAAARKASCGAIYNVSDGNPRSMTEYFNAVADILGFPRQPQVSREEARLVMPPLMYSYACESKVVDSSRMLCELEIKLLHPTLATGLPASVPEKK